LLFHPKPEDQLMNKKEFKEISQPPFLPTVSPEEIIDLLKVQKAKGGELLKNSSLSLGDLLYWNLFTKEILTKAFGPSREYINSILYSGSGEDKPLSAYEPEYNLERMRRNNLQMTLQAMDKLMEQTLLRDSPERELPKEAKDAKKNEPQGLPQIPEDPPPQQEKKDLAKELSLALSVPGESTSQETNQGVESMKKMNKRKVLVIPGPDEDRKKAVLLLLKKLDLEPLLVERDDDQGTDLAKKYEMYADAAFAVTLLTGDDMGFPKGEPETPKPRPRQDVIFELGFLMGLLHPQSGCVLYEEGLDLPSVCKEIALIPYDLGGLWKLLLAGGMKKANVDIDLNKAI
jgi:predicted nucleotide-binding protein